MLSRDGIGGFSMRIFTVPMESVVSPSLINATKEDAAAWKESSSVFFGVERQRSLIFLTSTSEDAFVLLLKMNILSGRIDM